MSLPRKLAYSSDKGKEESQQPTSGRNWGALAAKTLAGAVAVSAFVFASVKISHRIQLRRYNKKLLGNFLRAQRWLSSGNPEKPIASIECLEVSIHPQDPTDQSTAKIREECKRIYNSHDAMFRILKPYGKALANGEEVFLHELSGYDEKARCEKGRIVAGNHATLQTILGAVTKQVMQEAIPPDSSTLLEKFYERMQWPTAIPFTHDREDAYLLLKRAVTGDTNTLRRIRYANNPDVIDVVKKVLSLLLDQFDGDDKGDVPEIMGRLTRLITDPDIGEEGMKQLFPKTFGAFESLVKKYCVEENARYSYGCGP